MRLHVKRFLSSDGDAHGNVIQTHGVPRPWDVRGVAPGAMGESDENRDASLIAWTVYAAKSADAPNERDLVVVDGVDYPVEGRPKDWTLGPWPNPQAGLVVELRRVEG